MKLIAAIDKNRGIGYQNKLLVQIPQDMNHFQAMTMNQVIIMGRKTLESFPGGRPLYGRTNIVLTRSNKSFAKPAITCHSIEDVLESLKDYPDKEVYVIGGEEIYHAFLPYASKAYITYIDYEYRADAYFPVLPKDEWKLVEESEEQTYFNLEYYFRTYEKI